MILEFIDEMRPLITFGLLIIVCMIVYTYKSKPTIGRPCETISRVNEQEKIIGDRMFSMRDPWEEAFVRPGMGASTTDDRIEGIMENQKNII
jgi:hypothetical protein